MKTLFISDLHLDEQREEITQLFINFLQTKARKAQALYILGDFFEVWIGDDYKNALNSKIIKELNYLTETHGVPVYLMHGNRDFLISKDFEEDTGCQLLTDPTVINLCGQATLLMHGDTLCTEDVEYLAFRLQARDPRYQQQFLTKPLAERLQIALQIRQMSHQKASLKAQDIMDVSQDEVVKVMQKHKVSRLIHGHTHRPQTHQFQIAGHACERIVLGAWEHNGHVLEFDQEGYEARLLSLTDESMVV